MTEIQFYYQFSVTVTSEFDVVGLNTAPFGDSFKQR